MDRERGSSQNEKEGRGIGACTNAVGSQSHATGGGQGGVLAIKRRRASSVPVDRSCLSLRKKKGRGKKESKQRLRTNIQAQGEKAHVHPRKVEEKQWALLSAQKKKEEPTHRSSTGNDRLRTRGPLRLICPSLTRGKDTQSLYQRSKVRVSRKRASKVATLREKSKRSSRPPQRGKRKKKKGKRVASDQLQRKAHRKKRSHPWC